jgi:hypothetical protein
MVVLFEGVFFVKEKMKNLSSIFRFEKNRYSMIIFIYDSSVIIGTVGRDGERNRERKGVGWENGK